MDDLLAVIMDFYQYFMALTLERRESPGDDLASLIANGRIDGEPLPDIETVSYYIIVATAGHDTTASAMTGGLQALIENPEQLARLRREPELIPNAVDEMIRYVSPVRHFMRTAQADTEVAGVKIAKGDWLYLSYLAANRDPGHVRGSEPLRHLPIQRRPPSRVWLRCTLLPRCTARPDGAAHGLPRSAAAT